MARDVTDNNIFSRPPFKGPACFLESPEQTVLDLRRHWFIGALDVDWPTPRTPDRRGEGRRPSTGRVFFFSFLFYDLVLLFSFPFKDSTKWKRDSSKTAAAKKKQKKKEKKTVGAAKKLLFTTKKETIKMSREPRRNSIGIFVTSSGNKVEVFE